MKGEEQEDGDERTRPLRSFCVVGGYKVDDVSLRSEKPACVRARAVVSVVIVFSSLHWHSAEWNKLFRADEEKVL